MKNTKIIAISNQKGGVAKTTTAVNLGAMLSLKGYKVLLIDLDSQGSLSNYMGHEYNPSQNTINEVMRSVIDRNPIDVRSAICQNEENSVDYIPADIRFATMEMSLVNIISRETVLKRALNTDLDYDYIIIDCLPAYGIVLYNALTVADYVLVPVQAQKMALDGINLTLDTINEVQSTTNPSLELLGVISTFVENTNMSESVIEYLKENFDNKYLGAISKSVLAQYSSYKNKALVLENGKKLEKLIDEYSALADKVISVTVTQNNA